MKIFEQTKDDYLISTDPAKIDIGRIHQYISGTYWAKGIPLELVKKSVDNSLTFAVYHAQDGLIGCARVITDFATYHYLADVFIRKDHRRHGLGKWLMEVILAHPELQSFRSFYLLTGDAHGLYEQYGFETLEDTGKVMKKRGNAAYLQQG